MFLKGKTEAPKSVGIVGDGDDVELIDAFESVFGITFADEEAAGIETLGQAFEIICSKLPSTSPEQKKCLTAMAYYRLNRALSGTGRLGPETLVDVPPGQTPRSFQASLEDRTGLELGFLTGTSAGVIFLFFFQLVGWIAAPILFSGVTALVAALLIALGSHLLWRIAERRDDRVWHFHGTLGELSRRASAANFGKLVSQGGRWEKPDVWKTMTAIIEDFTGFPPENMSPELKFI